MDIPNPVTGLTEREVFAVRDNWRILATSWKTTGVEFFLRLFQAHPETKAFFKAFDGLEIDEIRETSKMRAHAINFKHGMTSFIENLDDECLGVLIQKLTENHFRRQIGEQHFRCAFVLFISLAKEMSEVDEFTENAWTKTLNTVAAVIGDHMANLKKQQNGV